MQATRKPGTCDTREPRRDSVRFSKLVGLRSPHSPQVRDLAATLWISGGYLIAWLSDGLRNAGGVKQVTVNFDQRSMLQDIVGLPSCPSIRVHE